MAPWEVNSPRRLSSLGAVCKYVRTTCLKRRKEEEGEKPAKPLFRQAQWAEQQSEVAPGWRAAHGTEATWWQWQQR